MKLPLLTPPLPVDSIPAMQRPISTNGLAQVQAAVVNGEKIAAIKIYREDTGASLSEAKQEVEKLEAEWRISFPEKFQARPRSKGCGICLIILLSVIGLILLLLLVARTKVSAP